MDDIGDRLWGLPKQQPRKPRRQKPLEREIQKRIENRLNALPGVHVTRLTVGVVDLPSGHKARVGLPGQGDLVGGIQICGLDVVLEVEVKRPGEAQRPSQVRRQELVERRGGCYVLATSAEEAVVLVERWRADAEARLAARGLR